VGGDAVCNLLVPAARGIWKRTAHLEHHRQPSLRSAGRRKTPDGLLPAPCK
jgi:hypothetical protein